MALEINNPGAGRDRFEVIDAFVDGRRVNAPDLKRVLAEEEGRDYFIDAWLLRETLQDEMALESVPHARARHARGRAWVLPIAVSLASLMAGGLVGYRTAAWVAAPAAVDTRATTPAVAPAPSPQTPSFPVPTPTRAIPMEFSADSGVGGGD